MFQNCKPNSLTYHRWSLGYLKYNCRKSTLIKIPLFFVVAIFCLLKVIILEENEAWTQEMSRDVSQYILPSKNTTIHYPRKLHNNFHKHVDFLLIVSSDPSKFDRREAIRETWGRDNHYGLRLGLVFLMGLSSDPEINQLVIDESHSHGDIVIENFQESYINLTIKSMMLVKFAAQSKINAEFIFKVDDDAYLNVPKLSEIYHTGKLSNKISGMLLDDNKPIRWTTRFDRISSRWICPKWLYPEDSFPNYISGLGYIFPTWMAKCLLEKSSTTPLVPIEDLFVTGILGGKCGFSVQGIPGFYIERTNPCSNLENEIVLTHDVKADEQILMHEIVTKKSVKDCQWIM